MNINEVYPRRFLSGSEIAGQRIACTIQSVKMEEMGFPKESYPVIYFERATKGVVLKKQNAHALSEAYGDETEGWSGKRVTLSTKRVHVGGEWQDSIVITPNTEGE